MTEFNLKKDYGYANESSSTIGVSNCSEINTEYGGEEQKDEPLMVLQIRRDEKNEVDRQPPTVPRRTSPPNIQIETDMDKKMAAFAKPSSSVATSPPAETEIEVPPFYDSDGEKKPRALPIANVSRAIARSSKRVNAKVDMTGLQTSPVADDSGKARKPQSDASPMRDEKRRERRLQRLGRPPTNLHATCAPINWERHQQQDAKGRNNATTTTTRRSLQHAPEPDPSLMVRSGESRPRSFELPQPGAFAAPPVPRSSVDLTSRSRLRKAGLEDMMSTLKLEALPVDEEDNERVRNLEMDNQRLRRQVEVAHSTASVDLDIAHAEEITVENQHTKVCGLSKRLCGVFICCMILVSAAIGGGVGYFLLTDDDLPFSPSAESVVAPISAPSMSPSASLAPTAIPSASPTTTHLGNLAELVMPGTDLSTIDMESNQYVALEWIGYNDPRTEPIFDVQELQERFSLVVLYYSTTGKSWNDNGLWLSGEHHCDWDMIKCNQEDKVIEVDIRANGLNGELATELGNLIQLRNCHFADNALRGTIPSELGRTALTTLRLSGNEFAGNIPSELGNLEDLRSLDVSDNFLNKGIPSEIGQLSNLRDLRLSGNVLEFSIPTELGKLTALELMRMNDNFLEGQIPIEIGGMSSLVGLQLQDNLFSGSLPTTIGSLSGLQSLFVGENDLDGPIASEIGMLTQLTMLSLNLNRLTGTIPSEIGLVVALEDIMVNNNRIFGEIPSELGKLFELTHLSLWSNRLTGSVPEEIEGLALLEEIYLDDNDLTGGLEGLFCNSSQFDSPSFDFHADCAGSSPDLVCECCSKLHMSPESHQIDSATPTSLLLRPSYFLSPLLLEGRIEL